MSARRSAAPAPATSPHVTVKAVADLLSCSPDHVYGLMHDGVLPYVDISRRGEKLRRPKLRIPLAQVEAYIARQTKRGAAGLRPTS
ncbi:helix-turn-helix domain-containing protein [Isoptericola variabilis]|uniref:helix-turn-helix domain-containing protein n=1 Tax=Isoptericola variabilis TaxID=139208 RepID=UPI003D1A4052